MDEKRLAADNEPVASSLAAARHDEMRALCAAAAHHLVARYRWSLLSPEELAERTLAAAARSDAPPASLERLARDQYSRALYAACAQDGNPRLRELAYADLLHYLYCAARQRRPEGAEDLAQRAIVLVIEQLGQVREPGAFPTFAMFKLLQVIRSEPAPPVAEVDPELADPGADLAAAAEANERMAALLDAVGRLPDERQRQVVLLKFFAGVSDEQIGARLQMTAGNVRVLRHRCLGRLRDDPLLRQYWAGEV